MSVEARARASKLFHLVAALLWTAMIPVTLLTGLKQSLPFIVFLSIYALIATHLSAAAGKSAQEAAALPEPDDTDGT